MTFPEPLGVSCTGQRTAMHPATERQQRATMTMMPSTSYPKMLCLLGMILVSIAHCREIPMEKAIPPLMDPIPTLPEITHRAYFKISIDGKEVGKIVFGLFGGIAPRTVENFRALASCSHGNDEATNKPLCYKDSPIHRVMPDFGFQGGDFTNGDGTGGRSIYPGGDFEDETFSLDFNRPLMLAMSNRGRNTNRSQWFVTTTQLRTLDGRYSIFGSVIEGKDTIKKIEEYGTYNGKPTGDIVIIDCGEEELKPEDKEVHY